MRLLLTFFSLSLFCNAQDTISFYFNTNKYELTQAEQKRLNHWIGQNEKSKILAIHGYTDEVGTTEYNDTLAQKRVTHIFNFIKNKIAIRDDFKTISYGENFKKSVIQSQNRRASVYYLKEAELHKENTVLGIKKNTDTLPHIPEDAPLNEKIKLAPVGTKIVLKNILFYQNTFAIKPESNNALYDLLFVLQNNPNLQIQIEGHICCVAKDYRKLSLDRAKQVRRFLVFKGIPQHRITVTGKGTSNPIYPIPEENEEQAAANRRVEIKITAK